MQETDASWSGEISKYREDIYFDAELRGHNLKFQSTFGLFSPKSIDEGTRLLLENIELDSDADCLDLGCGYGPIGMTLASLAPAGETMLVDKDYVAIEYSNQNIRSNQISNATTLLSNGLSKLSSDRTFDIIAMNLPAKIGNELTMVLFADCFLHLRPGGRLYVVGLAGMRGFVKRSLNGIFGSSDKLKQGKQHEVHVAVRE